MDEFALINRYFRRAADAGGVRVGIGDDGAVLQPSSGLDLVTVVDTLVEDVHFPPGMSAADLGYRAVAVNLSDIAAMGARPRWLTLALTLPAANDAWLEDFSRGLFDCAQTFSAGLVGGDTTAGATLTITIGVIGDVAAERALRRSGARAGDAIFVTGTPGDAAAGLEITKARIAGPVQDCADADTLATRFARPEPRVDLGQALVGLASAAIDVSDGLLGDLQKLMTASGCGAELALDSMPLSPALCRQVGQETALEFALTGGDDYELCFAAPASQETAVADAAARTDTPLTRIGTVTAGQDLVCRSKGCQVDPGAIGSGGYRHFSAHSSASGRETT